VYSSRPGLQGGATETDSKHRSVIFKSLDLSIDDFRHSLQSVVGFPSILACSFPPVARSKELNFFEKTHTKCSWDANDEALSSELRSQIDLVSWRTLHQNVDVGHRVANFDKCWSGAVKQSALSAGL
jgi:hypothetical protein